MIDIIDHVPFGQDNALTSREIWKRVDCWAETTIAKNLRELADSGAIKRDRRETAAGMKYIFWREVA